MPSAMRQAEAAQDRWERPLTKRESHVLQSDNVLVLTNSVLKA